MTRSPLEIYKSYIFYGRSPTASEMDVSMLCVKVLRNVLRLTDAERGSLFILRERSDGKRVLQAQLFDITLDTPIDKLLKDKRHIEFEVGHGIAGHVAHTKKALVINDVQKVCLRRHKDNVFVPFRVFPQSIRIFTKKSIGEPATRRRQCCARHCWTQTDASSASPSCSTSVARRTSTMPIARFFAVVSENVGPIISSVYFTLNTQFGLRKLNTHVRMKTLLDYKKKLTLCSYSIIQVLYVHVSCLLLISYMFFFYQHSAREQRNIIL